MGRIRKATRFLSRRPGFAATIILTLALGIGANSAIFSLVEGILLRPLPYTDPDGLLTLWGNLLRPGMEQLEASAPELLDYREQSRSLAGIAAHTWQGFNLSGTDAPRRIVGARVSANLFDLMGVEPISGRTFASDEDEPGRDRVVVVSYRLWQHSFGGDPGLVGKTLTLDNEPYTVIGIMPRGFEYPYQFIGVWKPLALSEEELEDRGSRFLGMLARRASDVGLPEAQAELDRIASNLAQSHPDHYPEGFRVRLMPHFEQMVGQVRPVLLLLMGAVGFVLLIACANVAGLLLTRAAMRQKEVAIRAALGASRWQIVRLLLAENVLLALFGGALGLLLAHWAVRVLVATSPFDLPRIDEVSMDPGVFGFTLAISLLTGVLVGLTPALHISKPDLNETLQSRHGDGLSRHRQRRVLVAAEIALSLVLLINAGLLIRNLAHLRAVDPGFKPQGLLTMRIILPASKYDWAQAKRNFFRELLERVEALPGVEAASTVTALPLADIRQERDFSLKRRSDLGGTGELVDADYVIVGPSYFRVMEIPLVRGRYLTEADAQGPPSVLVNDAMARRGWPGEDPVGQRLKLGRPFSRWPWLTVVGVVEDVKHLGPARETQPEVYVSYLEPRMPAYQVGAMFLVMRLARDPEGLIGPLRQEVLEMDPDQPIVNVMTMEERLAESISQERFSMRLLVIFAGFALLLSSLGIYGVTSYSVSQRTQEFGVRLALGATKGDLGRLVIAQGMGLTALGLVIGIVASWFSTRFLASQLYGLSPLDPLTFFLTSLLLSLVALLATYLPARRATRLDPIMALRYE